jgi:hypothetical protein
MLQIELGWLVSFSLLAENRAETKEQSPLSSALSSASCRHSGCSPAEPYPPHECYKSTRSSFLSLAKGTSLLCRTGDISILG